MPLKMLKAASSQYARLGLRYRILVSYGVVVIGGFALIDSIKQQITAPGPSHWVDMVSRLLCVLLLAGIDSELIIRPLRSMEQAVHAFTRGSLNVRVAPNLIPELHELGLSFNHMASSLQGVETRRRELTGDLAHELLSPLTTLRINLELLESGEVQPTARLYRQSLQEAQRLERLVQDMLALSKIEAGYLPLHRQPIGIPLLCKKLQLTWIETPDLQFDWHIPADLPLAYADADRVQQILVNLLSNAFKYTPSGTITISAAIASPYLWLTVSDTGIGIAAEDLPYIFDRFWRADASENPEIDGSGIGLAVTKRLVELQGGQIEVTSQLGQGSTFHFSLPLAH
jgi:signal transduction histidine kinase